MSIETVPSDLRNLRACLVCSLVKTLHQFEMEGCDNCDRFLGIKGDIEKCIECTSANFDGMIAVCDHNDSWVSKWQKINKKCQGVYAISVSGTLPKVVVQELKQLGIKYKTGQRDKSIK
ncbi:hypothetical protein ACQ4LE_008572 [Meloidogyne hapla]|uniref:Transcription elongation factor SPT4 n=1 Tax=Meloidogyne hapla TaxID=6305 RepID=A0A1I8BZ33_MELHA